MGLTYERLAWDSEFFGVEVGRVHLGDVERGSVTPEMVAALDRSARADGLACLYATVDPTDVSLTVALWQAGYHLVEVAMDLIHPTTVLDEPSGSQATIRLGDATDVVDLAPQFGLLAPWSRYAVDPGFGLDAARRMHEAWTARAAGPDPHRYLWVAEEEGEVVGFATGSTLPDELPRIDLIVATRGGSGVARRLVEFAYVGFGTGPSMGGPIPARNLASLRFVLGLGHSISTCRYHYHRWLTGD